MRGCSQTNIICLGRNLRILPSYICSSLLSSFLSFHSLSAAFLRVSFLWTLTISSLSPASQFLKLLPSVVDNEEASLSSLGLNIPLHWIIHPAEMKLLAAPAPLLPLNYFKAAPVNINKHFHHYFTSFGFFSPSRGGWYQAGLELKLQSSSAVAPLWASFSSEFQETWWSWGTGRCRPPGVSTLDHLKPQEPNWILQQATLAFSITP